MSPVRAGAGREWEAVVADLDRSPCWDEESTGADGTRESAGEVRSPLAKLESRSKGLQEAGGHVVQNGSEGVSYASGLPGLGDVNDN